MEYPEQQITEGVDSSACSGDIFFGVRGKTLPRQEPETIGSRRAEHHSADQLLQVSEVIWLPLPAE